MEVNLTTNTTRVFHSSTAEDHSIKWWTDCAATPTVRYIILFFYIMVVGVGIAGNSLSILILTRKRTRRRKVLSEAYRIYLVALAIADNGLLFFTAFIRYTLIPWIYDSNYGGFYEIYICRWHRFLMHFFHNASVWLLVTTALDRFFAVCFPISYQRVSRKATYAKKFTAATIIISIVCASPFLLTGPVYENVVQHDIPALQLSSRNLSEKRIELYRTKTKFSNYDNTSIFRLYSGQNGNLIKFPVSDAQVESVLEISFSQKPLHSESITDTMETVRRRKIAGCSMMAVLPEDVAYLINVVFHVAFAIVAPYFFLTGLNMAILYRIHVINPLQKFRRRSRSNRRITIMMLTVSFVFIALWLPQVIMLLLHSDAHSDSCETNVYLSSFAHISAYSNSALNFFLYCMTIDKFRIAARQLICRTNSYADDFRSTVRSEISIVGRSEDDKVVQNIRLLWRRKSNCKTGKIG
ncbi:putative G-protein coupled receptor 139 [Styela clava]